MSSVAAPEPAAAKRPRFFYGWVIVVVAGLGDLAAFSVGNASFGVFLRPMSDALGWSRTLLSGAAAMQSLANVVIAPILGPLVDRYDPRVFLGTGSVIACLSYVLMSGVTQPWQFYILYMSATALGLRQVGGFVTSIVLSKWFIRNRGRALAYSSMGNQIGAIFVVPLVAYLVENLGWRTAWATLGLGIAIIVLPPVLIFMRRRPEDMGLLPDGDSPEEAEGGATPKAWPRPNPEPTVHWTVRDALRTPTTWMLIGASNMWSLTATALLVHQLPFFTDMGMTLQEASFVVSFNNLVTLLAKFFWGYAAERVPVSYCLSACFALRATALLILLVGSGVGSIYVFAVVSGLGIAFGPLSAQIWADYYGRTSVGAIRGAAAPFNILSSLGGPVFGAVAFDLTGTYRGAFVIFSAAMYLGATLMFFAKPPGEPPVRASSAAADQRAATA